MMATSEDDRSTMSKKRLGFRALVDVGCVCLVAVPVLIINVEVEPFHRGFFCDDQSLMHPYKEDTVPLWALVICAIFVPFVCFVLIEGLMYNCKQCLEPPPGPRARVQACYRTTVIFFLGAAITQLLTEIGKTSVGRLRPHFLAVCKPANEPANCAGIFITDNLCAGTDLAKIREARLSFPSGHASMAMYSAAFLMVYLQARLMCHHAKLLRPVLQVVAFSLAFFTCLSRISDYKHHWSDVLFGGLLGVIVCYLVVISVTDFHHSLLPRRYRSSLCLGSRDQLPMYHSAANTASSSSDTHTEEILQSQVQGTPVDRRL